MLFCEIYLSRGAHTPDQIRALCDRLTLDRLLEDHAATGGRHADEAGTADPGVLRMLADLNHVVVHDIGPWTAGGRPVTADDPRYLARLYLPAPWRKEMSTFLIPAVTAALWTLVAEPHRHTGPRVEHEGTTYGFCSAGCHKHFTRTLEARAGR